jgi:preprotein translocase subunit SecE
MAMNREQKRAMQRRGLADADGAPIATRERRPPAPKPKEERTPPRQFISEVLAELRKTSWPTRSETVRLALIVLVAIVVLTAFIFGVDLLFSETLGRLFKTTSDAALGATLFL